MANIFVIVLDWTMQCFAAISTLQSIKDAVLLQDSYRRVDPNGILVLCRLQSQQTKCDASISLFQTFGQFCYILDAACARGYFQKIPFIG